MSIPTLLFIFDSPTQIVFVIAIVALLFGANKLPELAKSLGQSKKAFKEAMREADEEQPTASTPQITAGAASISDEELAAELQRRQAAKTQQ